MFNRRQVVLSVLIIIGLSSFAASRTVFFRSGFFEKVSDIMTYPFVWASGHMAQYLKHVVTQRISYQELCKEHQQLQQAFDELTEKTIKLEATGRFSQLTKELIDFQERYKLENALLARILVKEISPQEHSIIINRGTCHNVKKDMVAIYKLQILGKVVETHPYHSKVLLLTDRASQIAAFTNSTSAQGIVQGTSTLNTCTLSYITHLSKIEIGDLVFCSGQGLVFPEGFCLGKIIRHEIKKNEPYHSIDVAPLVDLKNITYCLLTDASKINLF